MLKKKRSKKKAKKPAKTAKQKTKRTGRKPAPPPSNRRAFNQKTDSAYDPAATAFTHFVATENSAKSRLDCYASPNSSCLAFGAPLIL